jgi:hypothetical protein
VNFVFFAVYFVVVLRVVDNIMCIFWFIIRLEKPISCDLWRHQLKFVNSFRIEFHGVLLRSKSIEGMVWSWLLLKLEQIMSLVRLVGLNGAVVNTIDYYPQKWCGFESGLLFGFFFSVKDVGLSNQPWKRRKFV